MIADPTISQSMNPALIRWLGISCLRQQPGPLLASIVAIAMGVALGLGISLVNNSALNEFDNAISRINGEAQYRLTGSLQRLDDAMLPLVEQNNDVIAASPVISLQLPVVTKGNDTFNIQLVALDIFRAAQVAPALLPRADATVTSGGAASAVFGDDAIFLSDAAQRALQLKVGEPLPVLVNGKVVPLIVSGDVPGVDSDVSLAIMDIAAAQWKLGWLGKLSRIDLRLAEGIDGQAWLTRLQQQSPIAAKGLALERPDAGKRRMSNLSRAYRVNLNVLALVALLTGGFIVFATMNLTVTRLVSTLSLVSVIGAPPVLGLKLVIYLALLLGILGSLLGTALGILLAWSLLALVGGDLGSGLFATSRPSLSIPIPSLLLFFTLGVAVAIAGGLHPALKLKTLKPAQALKSGQSLTLQSRFSIPLLSLGLFIIGLMLLALPRIYGLPIAAYLTIACWLFAGVLIVSPVLGVLSKRLSAFSSIQKHPFLMLATMRLHVFHAQAFPALAGVVASFALVCAMAIMVHSFRVSVDGWLQNVLPASLYVRVPTTGADAAFSAEDRNKLAAIEGVEKVEYVRSVDLIIDTEKPTIELIARTINPENPTENLPITGNILSAEKSDPQCTPVYISEPAAGLYNWQVADHIDLPITATNSSTEPPCFQIAAIWRDYARQSGAIAINRDDYQKITGDSSVSGASVWIGDDQNPSEISSEIYNQFDTIQGLQIKSAEDIRALSLDIFDRSFAVTYALEAVALLVSLFGVATTYSGEAISRMREFGMLRHLGITRRKISAFFVYESAFCITLGVVWGGLVGAAISQVLIKWVNPQSFNWTMQTHWPTNQLASAGAVLIILGVIAAVLAARKSAGLGPIEAVRRDW